MAGHLTTRGIIVQRARLRGSIHRIDPENTAIRRSIAIRRQVYHVAGPNYLWHLDGHHKLIRWKFVTHGGIDGYSRTITYLKCADNNRSSTVLSAFMDAVYIHGLPEHIRSDLGGENVQVWRFMVEQRGSSSVITGSSTHNERIERLWRDVYRCVMSIFMTCLLHLRTKASSTLEMNLTCIACICHTLILLLIPSFIPFPLKRI